MSILYIAPGESRLYSFDFSAEPEMVNGDTIASVDTGPTITPNGPTLGANVIDEAVVSFNISGATVGQKYSIYIRVVTTSGAKIAAKGTLICVDPKG